MSIGRQTIQCNPLQISSDLRCHKIFYVLVKEIYSSTVRYCSEKEQIKAGIMEFFDICGKKLMWEDECPLIHTQCKTSCHRTRCYVTIVPEVELISSEQKTNFKFEF